MAESEPPRDVCSLQKVYLLTSGGYASWFDEAHLS